MDQRSAALSEAGHTARSRDSYARYIAYRVPFITMGSNMTSPTAAPVECNRKADAGGRRSAAGGVPDHARVVESRQAGFQPAAQLSTVGDCLNKAAPPQLGEDDGQRTEAAN